jgi:diguanylate cyclase (GGDEF)-like protein
MRIAKFMQGARIVILHPLGTCGGRGGWALCLGLLIWPLLSGAGPLVGNPPIDRHEPGMEVHPQNFAIVQDARGVVYQGNHSGLLQFDGERWRLLRLPNHEIVRSLAVAGNRVYVGGYNSFGYAEEQADGQLVFTELSTPANVPEAIRGFADVWDVVVAPECVYFRALRDLFCWKPDTGEMKVWRHEGRFGFIIHHAGRTFLQFRGEGVRAREGADWRKLPGTAAMNRLVFDVTELPGDDLLGMGSDGRWWRLTGLAGEVAARTERMPAGVPTADRVHRAITLPDGSVALACDDGHVVVLDRNLSHLQRFRVDTGFISALAATSGGFLVSADPAFYRVSWPARWRTLDRGEGASGSLYGVVHWRDQLFIASSAGVLRGDRDAAGAARFTPAPWSKGMSYAMLPVDARRAVVALSHQLLLVEGDSAMLVGPEFLYPRELRLSALMPGQLLVGTEHGLQRGRITGRAIELSRPDAQMQGVRVSSMIETAVGEIWFGSQRGGLWRVRGDVANPTGGWREARRFGPAEGLATGPIAKVEVSRDAQGAILASTSEGFFRLDGERFVKVEMDGLAALRPANETFRIEISPNGDSWGFSINHIAYRPKGGAWRLEDVRGLKRGAIQSHYFDAAGSANFVTDTALLLHAGADAASAAKSGPGVHLRAVRRIDPSGAITPLPVSPDRPIQLPQGDYSVAFEFALPDFGRPGSRAYQGYLEGVEKQYYGWAPTANYTYTGLPAGKFTLRIRARDATGRITEMAPYSFIVEPPWYAGFWARVIAALLATLAAAWTVQWLARRRTVRLEKEQVRLEALVAERTGELAEANRRLDQIAHLDGLTGIPNRRRLDDVLQAVWQRCVESARPMSVLVIDVDHFKQYNDRHGHLAGDSILRSLAEVLARSLRRTEDVVARYGGEEFLVVLPGADTTMAMNLAESLRASVESSTLGVTISVGVATSQPHAGSNVLELVAKADKALYAAKHSGRNRVIIDNATEAGAEGPTEGPTVQH